jgi:hypothetical protein
VFWQSGINYRPRIIDVYKKACLFPLAAVEKLQGKAKPEHNPNASAKLFHELAAAGPKLADLHVNYVLIGFNRLEACSMASRESLPIRHILGQVTHIRRRTTGYGTENAREMKLVNQPRH